MIDERISLESDGVDLHKREVIEGIFVGSLAGGGIEDLLAVVRDIVEEIGGAAARQRALNSIGESYDAQI